MEVNSFFIIRVFSQCKYRVTAPTSRYKLPHGKKGGVMAIWHPPVIWYPFVQKISYVSNEALIKF